MAKSCKNQGCTSSCDDEYGPRKKPSWVVRVGIGILIASVAISSLLPLLSLFAP